MGKKRNGSKSTPRFGRYAKKRFGQHFLHNESVIQRIVDALEITSDDRVLEIGPGHGALTSKIEQAGPQLLTVVERDPDLALEIRDKCPSVEPLCADALAIHWDRLLPRQGWKIAGNLPYNVASPLMWDIFSQAEGLSRAVFMVQKEVGQRLVAKAGSRLYGALSVWVQSYVEPRLLFSIKPGAFIPPPKVDSAVLSFSVLEERGDFSPRHLSALVKMCFQKRRKQLGNTLKSIVNDDMVKCLESRGFDLRSRPEELTPKDFQALSLLVKWDF